MLSRGLEFVVELLPFEIGPSGFGCGFLMGFMYSYINMRLREGQYIFGYEYEVGTEKPGSFLAKGRCRRRVYMYLVYLV